MACALGLVGLAAGCDGSPVGGDGGPGPRMDGSAPRDGTTPGTDAGNPVDLSCLEMVPLRLWTTDPSAVAMLYRIETCDGEAVVLEPGAGESVFDYYTLTENGSALSSEATPDVERSERQRAYVTLLLDLSGSTAPVLSELRAAAATFVEELLGSGSDRVWVGIQIFDGRSRPVTIERPTRDLDHLRATLAGLSTAGDPAADPGSTDLHGAIEHAVGDLQSWQDLVTRRNDFGVVTSGYVVAFTDGRDTAERVTATSAAATVAAARTATGTDGLANIQTYAVALEGADYTSEARSTLQSIVGAPRYLYEGSLAQLAAQFRTLGERIRDQAEATHLLKYCSAARSGDREVELGIRPVAGRMSRSSILFRFSADGFAGGCAAFIETICQDRDCGGFNCGGCDDATESCRAESGACVNDCVAANRCSGETITNDLGYDQVCSPEALGESVRQCGSQCVDTASDDAHCGACGTACQTALDERCVRGACTCPGGGAVCGGSCQPPSFFQNNDLHCGTCGNGCPGGTRCVGTDCVCDSGQVFCNGECRDPDYFTSTSHCGTCGNACTVSGQACVAGSCACPSGASTTCGTTCRDLQSDSQHCGACDNACASTQTCVAGVCTCPGTDGQLCSGTCRDLDSTYAHCGACDSSCVSDQICVGGVCGCVAGQTFCNGACRAASYFGSRALDCGSCGNACAAACSASTCVGVAEMAAGGYAHSCARLTDGTVRCWGFNFYGELGDGTLTTRSNPVAVSGLSGVAEVAAGHRHTCARLTDGTVRCWGRNNTGQLGDGTTGFGSPTPVAVSGLSGVAELAAGGSDSGSHTCARLTDGTVRCWGDNTSGQLGDGTTTNRSTPVAVSGLSGVTHIAAGGAHTCARLTDGTVRCWGWNFRGQLGDGTTTNRSTPVAVSGLTGVAAIAGGYSHTCASLAAGTARCWGLNSNGQLGDGSTTNRSSPVSVAGLAGVAHITTRVHYTCARLTDGTVRCWGDNGEGQLGDGTTTDRATPVAVSGLVGAAGITTGGAHTCAWLTGGTARCWGWGVSGQLGDGATTSRLTPVAVVW